MAEEFLIKKHLPHLSWEDEVLIRFNRLVRRSGLGMNVENCRHGFHLEGRKRAPSWGEEDEPEDLADLRCEIGAGRGGHSGRKPQGLSPEQWGGRVEAQGAESEVGQPGEGLGDSFAVVGQVAPTNNRSSIPRLGNSGKPVFASRHSTALGWMPWSIRLKSHQRALRTSRRPCSRWQARSRVWFSEERRTPIRRRRSRCRRVWSSYPRYDQDGATIPDTSTTGPVSCRRTTAQSDLGVGW